MQIKFLSLGLLAAAVAAVAADTVNVHDTDVNAHNTLSGIANGVKVNDVAENLRANVASGLLSRREIADAICRPRLTRRNEDDKNRRKSLLRLLERQIKSEQREKVIRKVKVKRMKPQIRRQIKRQMKSSGKS
ncbi:hypothetical protein PS15p_211817 [Mucor circinelloides]